MGQDIAAPRKQLSLALGNVAKAQAAVAALSSNFDSWMRDEVAKLDQVRRAFDGPDVEIEALSALYMRAHDLKGLAPTLGYPLIHDLAAALCTLIDDDSLPFDRRAAVVDDHIDAIRMLVHRQVRTAADPVGRQVLHQLSQDVANLTG
jgi:hypothetical protein